MKKVHTCLSKIFLMAFLITGLLFSACSNGSGGSGGGEGGNGGGTPATNPGENHKGHKVTIHWQIPGTSETIEETWADDDNLYSFNDQTKTRDGYSLQGFKLEKPTAANYSDDYDYIDFSTYTVKTLEKDLVVYALWKNENYVLRFNEKKYNSKEKDYKTTRLSVHFTSDPFTFPDINKTSGEEICTAWAKDNGSYAEDANGVNSLSNLNIYMYSVPEEYEDKDMAVCQSYDFYECWYNLSQAKKYIFNKNDCSKSFSLSNCETKTISLSPYSKKTVDPSGLFTREGYTFLGFDEDPITTIPYTSKYNSGTTYYAIWEKNNAYITTYVKDYGAYSPVWVRVETDDYYRISDGKYEDGSPFFTKSGKTLGGWNYAHKVNGEYADYLPGQKFGVTPSSSLDIWYARWVDTSEFQNAQWEITFYNDGSKTESFIETAYNYPYRYSIGSISWSSNCSIVLPECPFTKDGYTFEGWTNGTDDYLYAAGRVVEFDNRTHNRTDNYFIAKWTAN